MITTETSSLMLDNQLVIDRPLRQIFPTACNVYTCCKCHEPCSIDNPATCISDCCQAAAWLSEW